MCAVAAAADQHRAVTLRGGDVEFYAGHLVLDARYGAYLDDGVLHVSADRIVLDLTANRFVAAGDVRVASASNATPVASGAALGVDLQTERGTLIALAPSPISYAVTGPTITAVTPPPATSTPAPSPSAMPSARPSEPFALADLEGELPFARAASATAHLGADVRLTSARVIVPGGRDVALPSYVYTFSSDVGYAQSNVPGSSEDVPIYFGSTRDSVSGAHFTYDPVTKIGFGLDHRIVDGERAYDLFAASPLNGPTKDASFTWHEQINDRATQTLNGFTGGGIGSIWSYDATDSIHRSYLGLSGANTLAGNFENVSWQGAYEPLGAGWAGDTFKFHLATGYGRAQSYVAGQLPVYDTTYETLVEAPSLELSPSSSLSLQADWRQLFDDQPHRQFGAFYTATLQHRWNRFLSTQLSDTENPIADDFLAFGVGTRLYVSRQTGSIDYANVEPFEVRLDITHQAAFAVNSFAFVQPWSASADIRFRVNASLSLDLSRSYGFGFDGSRFGTLGFQILP